MKYFLTCLALGIAFAAGAQTDYPFPWNPDSNFDGWVSTEDLLQLLTVFGTQFEPDAWETDSLSAAVVLDGNHNYFQCQSYCNDIEGNWRMADLDAYGRHFDLVGGISANFWVNSNAKLNASDFAYETYVLYGTTGNMYPVGVGDFSDAKRCMCYIQASPFVPNQYADDSGDELLSAVAELQEQVDSLQMELESWGQAGSIDSMAIFDLVDSLTAVQTGSAGSSKYLLRLEYDINESLIPENTVFVDAPGFSTTGATIVSQIAGGGSLNSKVFLSFTGESNPPSSILGYGWNPNTGDYTVTHYDRDTKQTYCRVGIEAFVQGSTSDGGSGDDEQWSGTQMSEAGNFDLELWVDQQALVYGNAIAAVPMLGWQPVYPHAYLIIQF